jgi:hypothetical protein
MQPQGADALAWLLAAGQRQSPWPCEHRSMARWSRGARHVAAERVLVGSGCAHRSCEPMMAPP